MPATPRALVVDDVAENLAFLEALLRGNGFEVHCARNGAEALEDARRSPPDLAISDILMPSMDGYALCREWMADERLSTVPFIFYTATFTGPKDEALGLRLGAARFVVKPQEPEVLMGVIREVLSQHREGGQRSPDDPAARTAALSSDYAEAISRKLEAKVAALESANRELERQVAERVQAEETLRQSEEEYRTLFDSAGDAIFIREPSGRILDANEVACARLGYSRAELLSMTPVDLEDPATSPEADERLEVVSRNGSALFETVQVARDGRRIPTEVNARLIRYRGRDAVLSIHRDVTERKRAEEVRLRLEEQLGASQRMEAIGSLAGGVAHDFNNLLSVILSYTGFALGGMRTGALLKEDLLEVEKAAESAAALTRRLLAFGRRQVLQPVPMDLNKVAEGMEKMLRRILGEDVDLLQVLAPDLGVVRADPSQLEQVLMNLVVNARDAMPSGGKLTIETSNVVLDEDYAASRVAVRPGPYVMLAVTDTGIGMDRATQARVFEPFFTTKEKGKGTGLGLSMVYGIVKQSGGNIWLYSEPGQGTTFKIYLPRDASADPAAAPVPMATPAPMRGTGTILVVEDEEALLRVAGRSLGEAGYTVLTAADGEAALRTAAQHDGEILLLVTDVIMPRMGGKELAAELAKSRPGLKVLYMSGYTDDAILHHGVLEPGAELLTKPFTSVDLARRVGEVLSGRPAAAGHPRLEPLQVDDGAEGPPLDEDALRALPPDVASRLRSAVIAGRYAQVMEIVESLEVTQPLLAAALRRLARRFDFERLRDLLDG